MPRPSWLWMSRRSCAPMTCLPWQSGAWQKKKARVPEDISIVGMDNLAQGAERGLTSVAPCFEQIGSAAVDAILTLLHGGSSADASQIIPVSMIERASVAAPRTREI